LNAVLADLAELERAHEGPAHGHAAAMVGAMVEADARAALRELERRGLVREQDGLWSLTERGRSRAGQP
jgi:hypothetical protein